MNGIVEEKCTLFIAILFFYEIFGTLNEDTSQIETGYRTVPDFPFNTPLNKEAVGMDVHSRCYIQYSTDDRIT